MLIVAFLFPAPVVAERKPGNIQRYDAEDDDNDGEDEQPLFAAPTYRTFGGSIVFFLRQWTFWIMTVCLLVSFGVVITFYNTAGAVAASVGSDDTQIAILFIIFGVVQTFGRLFYSYLYGTISAKRTHRLAMTLLIGVNAAVLFGVNLSAYFVNNALAMNFYLAAHSLVYGALWYLLVEIGNEKVLFGKAAEGTPTLLLYGLFAFAPAIGPLVFDSVSGALYDQAAEHQGCLGNSPPTDPHLLNDEECLCKGQECSTQYQLICTVLMGIVAVLSLISFFTSSRNFKHLQ